MKSLKKIAGINLLIMLLYSILIRIMASGGGSRNDAALGILLMSAFAVGAHVIICLLLTIVLSVRNNELSTAWLTSSGIVLLVGFSTCWGNASL